MDTATNKINLGTRTQNYSSFNYLKLHIIVVKNMCIYIMYLIYCHLCPEIIPLSMDLVFRQMPTKHFLMYCKHNSETETRRARDVRYFLALAIYSSAKKL